MYADVWLTKVAFDACWSPWLIRLIALSYNLRAVNLLQYQYVRLRMSFRNRFFWRGIQNHHPLTRHCNNFSCWRCFSNGFERHFSRTNVSLLDLQSRLPILHGREEKEAVFKYLAAWIRQGRVPGKRDCENCIAKSTGALERRDWTAVKYYVKNQNDKRKRVLTTRNNSL